MSSEMRFLSLRRNAAKTVEDMAVITRDLQRSLAASVPGVRPAPWQLRQEIKRINTFLEAAALRVKAVPITEREKAQAVADKNVRIRRRSNG